jgi:hypothetical protein
VWRQYLHVAHSEEYENMHTERQKLVSKFLGSDERDEIREHAFNSLVYSIANVAVQHDCSVHAVLREFQYILPRLLGNHKAQSRAKVIQLIEDKRLELQANTRSARGRRANYDSD